MDRLPGRCNRRYRHNYRDSLLIPRKYRRDKWRRERRQRAYFHRNVFQQSHQYKPEPVEGAVLNKDVATAADGGRHGTNDSGQRNAHNNDGDDQFDKGDAALALLSAMPTDHRALHGQSPVY